MDIDYTKYTAEEIAQELSFIQFIKNSDRHAYLQWSDYVQAYPSEEEKINQAKELVLEAIKPELEIHSDQVDKLWVKIDAATQEKEEAKILHLKWIPYSVAAGLMLLLGFYFLWPTFTVVQQAGLVEMQYFELPDQSEVILNSASNIRYNQKNWQQARNIILDGEAFFQVKKGTQFTVTTSLGDVKVLGTSFNVYARENVFEVKCLTGKVAVKWKDQEIILIPGEAFHSDQYGTEKNVTLFSVDEYKDWRKGWFEFKQRPLTEVFAEMERQFGISIEDRAGYGKRKYSGFFENHSLDSALHQVCWPTSIQYTIKNKRVILE